MERRIGSILFEPTKVLYRLLLYYLGFFVLFYFPLMLFLDSCCFVNSVVTLFLRLKGDTMFEFV
ncbi:unnamed protein product [Brassica rapa]|uniref:Uncharacterized protein n=1 Tax=Brassica campestris TaxID=3711 RepID=A0A8D9GJ42_BRACM|nr:unnamed protein product [Brassica rapa]